MSVPRKLSEKSIKLVRLLFICCLIIICHLDVKAEEAAEVSLYVEQVFIKNSSRDVNDVFAYNLISLDNLSPMPQGASNGIYSFTLAGTSAVKIPLTFTNVGIYQYQIKGNTSSPTTEYTIDSSVYKLTAFVKNKEGRLSAIIVVESGGEKNTSIRFENTYTPKASDPEIMVDPPVQKTVSGNPPGAMTFAFTLTAKDPASPMPEGSVNGVKEITIEGAGQKDFGTWVYTMEGIYHYEIAEVIRPNSAYTYDKSVYTITDFVEDQDGQLVVTRSVTNEEKNQVSSFIFNNEYRKRVIKSNEGNGGNGGKRTVIVDIAAPGESGGNMSGTEAVIASVSNMAVGGNVPKVGDDVNAEWYAVIFFFGVMVASGCMIYLIFTGRRREGN